MPRISQFYGISIYMYYRDHAPPHFHAIYGKDEAVIGIETTTVLDGHLPRRALNLVIDWLRAHQNELRANWGAARAGQPLDAIDPLD